MLIRRLSSGRHDDRPLTGWLRGALLAAGGIALTAVAAQAQLQVLPSVEANAATEIKASRPDFRYGWRVSNDGSTALEGVTVIVRSTLSNPAAACANAPRCTLGWRLDGQPLPLNSRTPIILGPAGSHELTYEGRAEDLGLYQSRAVVSTYPTPLDIRVRRVNGALGEGGVTVGPVGAQNLPFFFGFFGGQTAPVTIANKSTEAVTLSGPLRARLLRGDGATTFGNLAWEDDITCPALESRPSLAPGGQVSCNVPISWWTGPGRYRMHVSVGGPGIERADAAPADFSLRYHWGHAWLVLLLGGFLGARLEAYQNSGRRRALQLADVGTISGAATKALDEADAAAQRDTKALLQRIVDDLAEEMLLLRTSRTADFNQEITAVAGRLPRIGRFAVLEKEYDRRGRPAEANAAYTAAHAAVSADALPADADQRLDELKAAIDATHVPAEDRKGIRSTAEEDSSGLDSIILPEKSSDWYRNWVRRNDQHIACATIVLVATIGVVTLWKNNPTWGGIGDILLAFLTGVAATITGTLTIKGIVSSYTLPTLPAAH